MGLIHARVFIGSSVYQSEVLPTDGGYCIQLTGPMLARSVYLSLAISMRRDGRARQPYN